MPMYRLVVPMLALLVLVGCRDPSAPEPAIEVRLTSIATEPLVGRDQAGRAFVECIVSFDARATGDVGASASWIGFKLRFVIGPDRTAAVDSLVMGAQETAHAFGAPDIGSGGSRRVSWRLAGGVPFLVAAEVGYVAGGIPRSAHAEAGCGRDPAMADTAPPVVSIQAVEPDSTPPEPGDTLRFAVRAESKAGLWEVVVEAAGAGGPAKTWLPAGATAVSDSIAVVVPRTALPGQPLVVEVRATDVLTRARYASAMTLPVVDRQPPRLIAATMRHSGEPSYLGGQFPRGAAPMVTITAEDDGLLRWVLVGSADGTTWRDSVLHPGTREARIPLPAQVSADGSLRVQLRDAGGNLSEPIVAPPGSFLFYPRNPGAAREVVLPFSASAYSATAAGDRLYVLDWFPGTVHPVRLDDLAREAPLELSTPIRDVSVTPDGRALVAYAVGGSEILLAEPAEPGRIRTVPLETGLIDWFSGLAATSDGRALVLKRGRITDVHLASGVARAWPEMDAESWLYSGVVRSADGKRILFGRRCLWTGGADGFERCGDVAHVGTISASHDGSRWAAGLSVYDATLQPLPVTRLVEDHPFASRTILSPDGRHLLIPSVEGLLRARISDGVVEDVLGPALNPHQELVLVSGGNRVVVAHDTAGTTTLLVYDLP